MSQRSLEHLRSVFGPAIWALDSEQVASVLGKQTRGEKQRLREQMKSGDLPGARKQGGRYVVPVEDLAEWLEPTPSSSPAPSIAVVSGTPRPGGRRRATHGPRIAFMRRSWFWEAVCRAMGWEEEADDLGRQAIMAREEGIRMWSEGVRARLMALIEPDDLRPPTPPNPI